MRFSAPCTSLLMSLENALVQDLFAGPRISFLYPYIFPVVRSRTPWKSTAPSHTDSTTRLDRARDHRMYLWGGLISDGSILSVFSGCGPGGGICGTAGGNLGGARGSALICGMGDSVAVQVRLGCGVGVGVCVPDTSNVYSNSLIASMVWVPK